MALENNKKLMTAARQGKLDGEAGGKFLINEIVKIQGDLDFNEKPYYRSALWEATWKNNDAFVRVLIEKGASVNFADYEGRTPLHEAAYYGHDNLVELLLEKNADIDAADQYGQPPLFRAVEGGRGDIVKLLVDKGAKTNVLDTDDVTVQHLSSFKGNPNMAWWLFYKGAWKNRFCKEQEEADKKAEAGAATKGTGPADGAAAAAEGHRPSVAAGAAPPAEQAGGASA